MRRLIESSPPPRMSEVTDLALLKTRRRSSASSRVLKSVCEPSGVAMGSRRPNGGEPLAVLHAFAGLVDHRVGVVDAHPVGARVLLDDIDHGVIGAAPRPVALPLEQDLLPRDGDD